MKKLSLSQKKIIKLIGDVSFYLPGVEIGISSLEKVAKTHPFFIPRLEQELSDLLTANLVIESVNKENKTFYHLTLEGKQIYEILKDSIGLAMQYDDLALEALTDKDLKSEIFFVKAFFENWIGELVHWLGDALYEYKALEGSLFFCYIASQTAVFDWLSHSLLLGAYDIVLRELRSLLEGLFTVYYIDIKNPTQSLEEKLQILSLLERQGKSHGKAVFERSSFGNWKPYYNLYCKLCNYVHVSKKISGQKMLIIAKQKFPEIIEPAFDKDIFITCFQTWKKIAILSTELTNSLLASNNIHDWKVSPRIF